MLLLGNSLWWASPATTALGHDCPSTPEVAGAGLFRLCGWEDLRPRPRRGIFATIDVNFFNLYDLMACCNAKGELATLNSERAAARSRASFLPALRQLLQLDGSARACSSTRRLCSVRRPCLSHRVLADALSTTSPPAYEPWLSLWARYGQASRQSGYDCIQRRGGISSGQPRL